MRLTITRAQLESSRTRLKADGVDLVGDSGTVSHAGVVLAFTFIEPYLDIEIMHKPFIVSQSFVTDKINEWFKTGAA